jgi:hypothetical protein
MVINKDGEKEYPEIFARTARLCHNRKDPGEDPEGIFDLGMNFFIISSFSAGEFHGRQETM